MELRKVQVRSIMEDGVIIPHPRELSHLSRAYWANLPPKDKERMWKIARQLAAAFGPAYSVDGELTYTNLTVDCWEYDEEWDWSPMHREVRRRVGILVMSPQPYIGDLDGP